MLKNKLYILKENLREGGLIFTLREKIIPFLSRPFSNLVERSFLLLNLRYSFSFKKGTKLEFNVSPLLKDFRKFWYLNTPGDFDLEGERISREDIFMHGGPNPHFKCPVCQKAEWLSRVRQKDLFIEHSCLENKRCKELCSRQGDELWTHFHQNFDFCIGCDDLPVPKVLYIIFRGKDKFLKLINKRLEPMNRVRYRQLALNCQIDVVDGVGGICWTDYDFVFIQTRGCNGKFKKPDIPVILFGHDFWPLSSKKHQWVINWLKPGVFLTTYPAQWKKYFKFPINTKIVFYPMFPSMFFTRPDLGEKDIDLLVIGSTAGNIYKPRAELEKQILKIKKHNIKFSNETGAMLPVKEHKTREGKRRFLNEWSRYLGSAKYVIFGRMEYPILLGKYYEALGSGAVPIFPEVPDLRLLGVKPFEHYIPLSEVEGDNEKLEYFLDNFEKYKYIAEKAVNWYKENSDRMLFEDFQELIGSITNHKYPKILCQDR